jgi:hypothetical protein
METEDLPFKIVKVQDAHDEVIARVGNLVVSKAAFEKALFVYPQDHLELRGCPNHFDVQRIGVGREPPARGPIRTICQ